MAFLLTLIIISFIFLQFNIAGFLIFLILISSLVIYNII